MPPRQGGGNEAACLCVQHCGGGLCITHHSLQHMIKPHDVKAGLLLRLGHSMTMTLHYPMAEEKRAGGSASSEALPLLIKT